ncbi:MAG: hypothetical protein KJO98_08195 [Rhodothermia bacterium]|nr:hypothetical protein [Rhodothermia bacterium]
MKQTASYALLTGIIALSVVCTSIFAVETASAQMDLEDEIRSLTGHNNFGLVVDIESNLPEDFDGLVNSKWRQRLGQRLRERAGIVPTADLDPTRDPHLYIHVNAMGVGDNLIPFSIEGSFVQMVQVDKGKRMMAVTWESGLVGLVSRSETPQILDAGAGLVDQFVSDLKQSALLN